MDADAPIEVVSAERLRTIVLVDTATCIAATAFIVVVHLTVVDTWWLLVAAGLVAAAGALMAAGLVPLRHGRPGTALRLLAVANWAISILAATIATFSWPLMMLTALLPAVLAASMTSRREIGSYVAVSVVVSLAVVLVGLLQDFSGLTGEVPTWLRNLVVIVFAPLLVALLALMVMQNSLSMQRVVAAVQASRGALAEHAAELRRSRSRVVAATDRERRRIERDLHDGAQQRLIGIGIALSRAKQLTSTDTAAAVRMLDELRRELRVAHEELRDLAQGLYPPVLTEHGLEAALQSAADRCQLPVALDLDAVGRHAPEVEAALYFCCVEAMQNAAKHSAATSITVRCGADGRGVWVSVHDDGVGFDPVSAVDGAGIVNMRDRLGAVGGTLELAAGRTAGVTVRGRVPLDAPPS